MYTVDEIKEKLLSTTPEKRDIFYAHLFCDIILENNREDTLEEEYLEALIFTSYLIYSLKSTQDEEHNNELLQNLLTGILNYSNEIEETDDISNILEFVAKRFDIIRLEWREMGSDENYLTPILIDNLYFDSLNEKNKTVDDVMSKLDFEILLKYVVMFRTKLKHLLEALSNFQ